MADSNDFEHFDFHQQTAQKKYQDRKRNCGSAVAFCTTCFRPPVNDDDEDEEVNYIHMEESTESEEQIRKGKPKPMKTKDRNVCGSNSIVVLYILLMATSMVWMILLSKAFAKHSEISAEIENLRNSRTILKGNDSAISAELQELRNTLISLKANGTQPLHTEGLHMCVFSDSKITTNVTNLENYVSKVCTIKTCPCEWALFSGTCYYFSNENRDWKKAREFCQSQDSDLTVINSDEELNYLKGKVRVDHLVGMSDFETEGVWKWLDGSLVDGRMWNPGEPNNQGKEDCGEMSNGKLNDIPCNLKQRWICEKTL
ncbi:CD209 antigen-like protein D isoform X2 [Acipenser oxyrinchus oxyrinchus]|uniref:CD209 antigen-like protein D isoform X2 n=1 Tax=Acipenser oxyrinchus oxyrinchus TaxID=40147 RepID=A0AAD8CLP6_ACIOX|nr:CD209 antigen-like protein D isoform X2 [Acipenser oxyrinchus oxyrinchus]